MSRAFRLGWIANSLIVVAGLAACSPAGPSPAPTSVSSVPFSADVLVVEANVAPARIVKSADGFSSPGSAVTIRLSNTGKRTAVITAIEPNADAHLSVEYLGFSDCKRGCPFAVEWDAGTEQLVRNGVLGTLPIRIAPDGIIHLEFRLRPVGAEGIKALQSTCQLRVDSLVATFENGAKAKLGFGGGGWLAGINALPKDPGVASKCAQQDQ